MTLHYSPDVTASTTTLRVGDRVSYTGILPHPEGRVIGIDRYENRVDGQVIRWCSYTITSASDPEDDPLGQMQRGERWWLTNKPGIGLMEWVWRGHAEAPGNDPYTAISGDISLPEKALLIPQFSGQVTTQFDGAQGVSTDVATLTVVQNPNDSDQWLSTEEFRYASSGHRAILGFRATRLNINSATFT